MTLLYLALKWQNILRVLENATLRKIFRPKRENYILWTFKFCGPAVIGTGTVRINGDRRDRHTI
jgi:hypothetical protein